MEGGPCDGDDEVLLPPRDVTCHQWHVVTYVAQRPVASEYRTGPLSHCDNADIGSEIGSVVGQRMANICQQESTFIFHRS